MSKEEVVADKLLKAEARTRQRFNQKLARAKSVTKEEVLVVADKLFMAEARRRQREKRNLMSKEEQVLADKLLKAEARRRQRINQKLKSLGLENVERTLEVTFSND